MAPVAAILEDKQLVRVLTRLELPVDFPKLLPARSPPLTAGEDSQAGCADGTYDGMDAAPPDDLEAPSEDSLGA